MARNRLYCQVNATCMISVTRSTTPFVTGWRMEQFLWQQRISALCGSRGGIFVAAEESHYDLNRELQLEMGGPEFETVSHHWFPKQARCWVPCRHRAITPSTFQLPWAITPS